MPKLKAKHSKFRNTGLLFEMLVRQLTVDQMTQKKKNTRKL